MRVIWVWKRRRRPRCHSSDHTKKGSISLANRYHNYAKDTTRNTQQKLIKLTPTDPKGTIALIPKM